MRYKAIALAALLGLAVLWPSPAKAGTITYKGVALSPAIEQLSLNKSRPSITYKVRLDNNQSVPLTLQASSLDFKSLNASGGLAFITSNPNQLQYKYGLASWISLPTAKIVLPPGGGQFVKVTINNRPDLAPGGHYAAILFKVVSPAGLSGSRVQVNQVISQLVFLRKSGGEIYGLNLTKNTIHRHFAWFGWPSQVDDYFYNSGNTQTAPRGVAQLDGVNYPLNPDSSLVLPESTRLISTSLGSSRMPFWPGVYQLKTTYRPDGSNNLKAASASFIYISWRFLVALAIMLAAILAGLPRRARLKAERFVRRITGSLITTLKWLLINAGKLVWKGLVYLDYLGGVAMLKWDKRRAKKARRK